MAHAIAPQANIMLILSLNNGSNSASSVTNLAGAINLAISNGANIISMSWGSSEFNTELSSALETIFKSPTNSKITFIASAGDSGGIISYPSCSSNVMSIGGTELGFSKNQYICESGWIVEVEA